MSNEFKNSLIIAFFLSAIITLATIFLGNTGSGFFRNSAIFIIGTFIGTPLAMVGKSLGSLWNEEIFKYIGFIMGALLGVVLAVILFSSEKDDLEMAFLYQCVTGGFAQENCQCTFDSLAEQYNDKELETVLIKANNESMSSLVKSFINCSVNDNEQSFSESKLTVPSQPLESNIQQENSKKLIEIQEHNVPSEVSEDLNDKMLVKNEWRDIQTIIKNSKQAYISECMESYIKIAKEFGGVSRKEASIGLQESCERELFEFKGCMAMESEDSLKCYKNLVKDRDI